MLNVRNINKTIEDKKVLHDISFSLTAGTITGLIGRNGTGKTTILKTIAGILDPTSGDITFNNLSIQKHPSEKVNFVYVSDSTQFLNSYTPNEIAKLYISIYPTFDFELFKSLMSRFQLPLKKIRSYSKGMKAQLAIILAFSSRVSLVLLDEPTNGLDPIVKRQILQFIVEEVAVHNVAVLISTHHLNEIEQIADQVILLRDGKVDLVASIEDAKERYVKVQAVFKNELPERLTLQENITVLGKIGRVYTLLINDSISQTYALIEAEHPLLLEEIPMTLEDIFVILLGGDDYVS
ncbi:ABC transporter ATP-binding protein [Fictibacillus macauensis ZFHKF-1]|uniref:ABC transporter ATP-binding protein n=1 Tax=Fictibacillus macauensis ZFHKF-1 TaxID=1196324 RepID=I8UFX2_9BACL|nr:ABC transporter ATP-binding protein [Fictibacillus macauensis]EIT85800.1 ABC transporter ATP-binding protein [Fictibacillus macauensis ZFHKF-1]